MDKKIKLGIIGVGNMGSGHAMRISMKGENPELELVAVADIDPKKFDIAKEKGRLPESGITYFTDATEMLDSGLIEACIVAVPHYDHPKYAMQCLERGIHVMVEKPAGVYTKQAREMNECAAKHPEVVFGMMFNQRTNHIYRKMRELVHSGKYGQIRRVNWLITNWFRSQLYYDSGDWRATWSGEGGGVLINQCPHQLDLLQWICGMPIKVDAKLHFGKWHDIEVEDDVTAYLEFANGATGVFVTTTGDPCGTNRFEVQMEKAKIVADESGLQVWVSDTSPAEFNKIVATPFASIPFEKIEVETDGQNPQHTGVLNAWAAAILRGEPMIAHGSEGINGLTLGNAMHLSGFLGKPVEVPFDEDLYYNELMKRVATSRRKTNVVEIVGDTEGSYAGTK